jgi:hypothetical protein
VTCKYLATAVLISAAIYASGCVEAGSLENEEEFRALLVVDGGGPGGGSSGEPATGTGGAASGSGGATGTGGNAMGTGGAASGSGGGGATTGDAGAQTGCAEACELIAMRCAVAGCHGATGPASGLDLASPDIGTRLSGTAATSMACNGEVLIDPESPDDSILYGKLLDPPACGTRMPLGAPLTAAQIDCIRRWVADPVCEGN